MSFGADVDNDYLSSLHRDDDDDNVILPENCHIIKTHKEMLSFYNCDGSLIVKVKAKTITFYKTDKGGVILKAIQSKDQLVEIEQQNSLFKI